ncbi:hypothetical protein [Streptomyces sp. NBC_00483]|uniref:hypothetical protein n=1 Tax=Streptomyces sp. NBC_00483 TaxID=2975756 RepID=UPI002E17E727
MAQAEQQLGFSLQAALRGLWSLNDGVSDSDAGAFLNGLGLLPMDVALSSPKRFLNGARCACRSLPTRSASRGAETSSTAAPA